LVERFDGCRREIALMATSLKPLPPLPTPTERLVNPQTGVINTSWYLYLKRLDEHLREVEQRITVLGG
jgi:hypothetical protein